MAQAYARLLVGLYGSTFLIRASFAMVIVLISSGFSELVGEHPVLYGLLIALNPLAELVTVPMAGILNDRHGRRPILLTGIAIAAASLGLRIVWTDMFGLAILNLLHGASAALILVTSLALLADHAPRDSRGREMGAFDFVTMFGYVIGFVAGFLLSEGTVAVGYAVSAGLAGVALVFTALYVKEARRHETIGEVRLRDLVQVATNPRVALVVGPWLVVFTFIGGSSGFIERFTQFLGVSQYEAAAGVLALGIVLLVSQIGFGRMSDKYGRAPLMLLGSAGFFVLMTAIAVGVMLTEGERDALLDTMLKISPLLAIAFLATLAFGPAALAALADEAEKGPSGITMSMYSLVLSLGFIMGPIVTGAVQQVAGAVGLAIWFEVLAFTLGALVYMRHRHEIPHLRLPRRGQ